VLSDSLCERIRKWKTCLIFKEHLAGESVTRTVKLLGVSRARFSLGYFGIHDTSWEDNISKEE
jgi:hypothetical protein